MSNASIFPPNRDSTDWLKYFPFEKRSWRQLIAESGLPDEAQKLIRSVIKKSRLMRYEKIEVIQELVGHFQDGLLAGNDYPYLIANFGDPDVTARLLRRSKIRNRPIMLKVFQIFGWMILGILSAYFAVFAYFHSASPSPSVDYMAQFNALQNDVEESDKAWPIYRPLWIKYGFSESGDLARELHNIIYHEEGDDRYDRLVKPGDSEWPAAIAKLEEISDLMDAFRDGAKKSRFGLALQADVSKYSAEDFEALFPNQSQQEMIDRQDEWTSDREVNEIMKGCVLNVLLPHMQQLRAAARLFVVDTRWAVEQNDPERAVRNFETLMGLASQAADCNILVGSLIGFAVAGIGFDELEETLMEHPDFFNDEQLTRLQKSIGNVSFTELTRIEGERAFQLDLVQRAFSDDGNGNGRITPLGVKVFSSGLISANERMFQLTGDQNIDHVAQVAEKAIAPAAIFVVASRKETEDKIHEFNDAYELAVKQPFWERELPDVEKFLTQNQVKHAFLGALIPAFEAVIGATDRLNGRQEGILAGLALQRYYLAHQKWPDSLVELSPDYIVELPIDIINGQELRLTFDEVGPVVYSVGNDGDDDGGKLPTREFNNHPRYDGLPQTPASYLVRRNNQQDGDWIVWPQTRFNDDALRAANLGREQVQDAE